MFSFLRRTKKIRYFKAYLKSFCKIYGLFLLHVGLIIYIFFVKWFETLVSPERFQETHYIIQAKRTNVWKYENVFSS